MAKKNVRNTILEAVTRVVAKGGLASTTIEAVAAEAGVSKGGLLYYFSTKKDLLVGMIERYETGFYERLAVAEAELPEKESHRKLKATVKVMLADLDLTREDIPNFATALDDADIRNRIGEFKKRLFKEICAEYPNPGRAALLLYAIDGLWMNIRFESNSATRATRAAAAKELYRLIDEP